MVLLVISSDFQKHKCVPLEDIAAEFKLRTQVALASFSFTSFSDSLRWQYYLIGVNLLFAIWINK